MFSITLLAIIAALSLAVHAGLQLDYADVPAPCVETCRAVAELSGICDVDADFDDNNERVEDLMKLQCICTNNSFDVPAATALCASCIDQNGMPSDKDDNMDDIGEIMARCGFPNATWTPEVAAAAPNVLGVYVIALRLTSPAQLTTSVDFAPPTSTASAAPTPTPGGMGGEGGEKCGRGQMKTHKWKHTSW